MPCAMAGAPSAESPKVGRGLRPAASPPERARAGQRGRSAPGFLRLPALQLLLTLLIPVLCPTPGCGGGDGPPPNFLLVTADSLRADRLSCYGGPEGAGQSICRLAERSTRYVWALAPATEGGPAAASLLSSRLPSEHGLDAHPASFLRSDVETVVERLAARGYRTAAFVSSPELLRSRNLDQGFEVYDDRLEREDGARPARSAALTARAALAWIDAHAGPWAVWIHFGDLHGPYPPPPIPDYEVYRERQAIRLGRIDAAVQTLLSHLDQRDLSAEIFFVGLHGEAAGEEGHWFEHGHSLGLEQVRVPLVWSHPGQEPAVVRQPVSTLDVAPTWLREAGLGDGDDSEGIALPRKGDPPGAPGTRVIYAESPNERAVAAGRYYYVRSRPPRTGGRIAELGEDGTLPVPDPADRPGLQTRVEALERHLAERWSGSDR